MAHWHRDTRSNRYSTASTSYSVPPAETPPIYAQETFTEDDDFIAALALQLEELEFTQSLISGKSRENAPKSDRNVALSSFADALGALSHFHSDRRMAQSIADAVHRDAPVIAEAVAVEAMAVRDRDEVLRMQNISRPATPSVRSMRSGSRARSVVDQDDTASVFNDYETSTAVLPPHLFEQSPEYEYDYGDDDNVGESSSSRPQAFGMEFYCQRVRCSICTDEVPQSTSMQSHCPERHIYCKDCLRRFVFEAMKDESMYPLKCCKVEIPNYLIENFLTPAEFQQYRELRVEYSTANRIYCTNSTCFKFIPPYSVSGIQATCQLCDTKVCTLCKQESHPGRICQRDQTLQEVIQVANGEGWRSCFRCHRIVDLMHGCNHITCLCKAEFCYQCGVQWKNCACETWEEGRLTAEAVRRVERDAEGPLMPAVRQRRIVEAQQQIEENHDCEHPGRFQRREGNGRRGMTCEVCGARHWKYMLFCRRCELRVCEECRRFRV